MSTQPALEKLLLTRLALFADIQMEPIPEGQDKAPLTSFFFNTTGPVNRLGPHRHADPAFQRRGRACRAATGLRHGSGHHRGAAIGDAALHHYGRAATGAGAGVQ